MKAYCDGSGSFDTSNHVVLAGVAASESVWRDFSENWHRILCQRNPTAPYLHMRELVHGQGAFADNHGWTEPKRHQLVMDLVMYVQHIDKKLFRSFICSIDMKKYRELDVRPELFMPTPVSILNAFVPTQMFKWFCDTFEQWESKEIYYFFDQNERFKGAFEKQVLRRKKASRLSNSWHMVKGIGSVDMRDFPEMQLADLLAWSHHRKLNSNPDARWASVHVFTDAVLPYTRKDFDAQALDWIATAGQIDSAAKTYFD